MAAKALQEFLTQNSLTQAAFAARAGMRPVDVSRILSGDRRPTLQQAAQIENAADIKAASWVLPIEGAL